MKVLIHVLLLREQTYTRDIWVEKLKVTRYLVDPQVVDGVLFLVYVKELPLWKCIASVRRNVLCVAKQTEKMFTLHSPQLNTKAV